MTEVDAIYRNGVFKPLSDVGLSENQRVRLSFQPLEVADTATWLARVQQQQHRIITQRGCFPDSALDIAEDRKR
jgi:predicted DNA-binding antitoxin AbrB/MazE fold protein